MKKVREEEEEGRAESASQTKLYISQTNKWNETGKYSAIQKEVAHTHTHTCPKFYVHFRCVNMYGAEIGCKKVQHQSSQAKQNCAHKHSLESHARNVKANNVTFLLLFLFVFEKSSVLECDFCAPKPI